MKRDNATVRSMERASTDISVSLVIRELIPKRRHIDLKTVINHFQIMQDIMLSEESLLVTNLTDVKNVGIPLPRSQH